MENDEIGPAEENPDPWGMDEIWESQREEIRQNPLNFIEIKRMPKKVEPRALTSMIISGTKIVPKLTEICCEEGSMEKVALVEFKTPRDASMALDRLRMTPWGRSWRLKLMTNPKFADPMDETIKQWRTR